MVPQLVAHRGFSAIYPENTLLSIEQAFLAGACFVECDVQITRDGVAVLSHDDNLQRTCGLSQEITELNWPELQNVSAHYANRFGGQHGNVPLSCLDQLLALMKRWPRRQVFIEIKRASIRKFGERRVIDTVVNTIGQVSDQCVVISFDFDIVQCIGRQTTLRTGWVYEEWNDANLALAEQLAPDYVFVDYECLPHNIVALPESQWHWVLYEIDNAATAMAWVKKGASYIETNDIGGLLTTPEFAESRCDD